MDEEPVGIQTRVSMAKRYGKREGRSEERVMCGYG